MGAAADDGQTLGKLVQLDRLAGGILEFDRGAAGRGLRQAGRGQDRDQDDDGDRVLCGANGDLSFPNAGGRGVSPPTLAGPGPALRRPAVEGEGPLL